MKLEVDELCAKLITLVPPSEAAPLLWSARPWPQRLRNEKPRLRRGPVFGSGKSGPRSASRSAYSSHSAAAPADYKPSPRCCASFRIGAARKWYQSSRDFPALRLQGFFIPPPPVGLGSREVTHRSPCARRR
jgi:hypothetical protein